ncbi:MAG TPA: NADH-quinone oxidoreductase subunit C [Anaerolineae bacterium]|nr:NADH-quinone oxidoreductase subunit C [Anaerolineae bacterium]
MKAVLITIEGAIGDTRVRQPLAGKPKYYAREELLKDAAVPDSVRCLRELAHKYKIVYLATRPEDTLKFTQEWLQAKNFPDGPVYFAVNCADRPELTEALKTKFEFAGGIGAAWRDNELHLELGCPSIILKEFEGNWDTVRKQLLSQEHSALRSALSLLEPWAKSVTTPEPHRLDVRVAAPDLMAAVQALVEARWGYLTAITGLDHPGLPADVAQQASGQELQARTGPNARSGAFEALYHFCNGAAVVTLRVSLPRASASVPSVCSLIPAASFFERELSEMFGVNVVDTPVPDRLFLPDDWPAGVYPLRKDFVVAHPPNGQDNT